MRDQSTFVVKGPETGISLFLPSKFGDMAGILRRRKPWLCHTVVETMLQGGWEQVDEGRFMDTYGLGSLAQELMDQQWQVTHWSRHPLSKSRCAQLIQVDFLRVSYMH